MTLQINASPANGDSSPYPIRFPQTGEHREQNHEWCEVYVEGEWKRLRLHDYADIYDIPGLYEHLFARTLQCSSPQRVVGLLTDVLKQWRVFPAELSVVDVGAGNGMVGEQLRAIGVRGLVGVDIIPEARTAANRDRPALYDGYVVADLCHLTDDQKERLSARNPNCLTTVSALGFGDIPTKAFKAAFDLISTPGWLAFNIKETFLNGKDESGFSRLICAMSDREIIQIQAYRRYSHRLSIEGVPLNYVAMVARKQKALPMSLAEELQ